MKLPVTLERDERGMIVAECPAIPGCVSQGRTEEETLANIKEAIVAFLEVRAEQGLPGASSNPIAPVLGAVHTPIVPNARKLTYTVVLEEDPPRHWHAYAPAVPGCFGGGRTRTEALRRYRAALRLHLEELAARGGSLPIERRSPAVQVVVAA